MSPAGDDDHPVVEFLERGAAPAPSGAGDELSSSRERRSARWYLVLSAVVLAAAALIAGKVSSNDSTAAASRSASAPAASTNSIPQPDDDPAQCPGPTRCAAKSGVPDAAAAALVGAFPSARFGRASTVYLRTGGLWFREINARTALLDILVRIERSDRGTPVTQSSHDDTSVFVSRLQQGFIVQVRVTGPHDQLPAVTNLYGLADDRRLLDLG
jgi:hypothetical protein